MLTKRFDVRWLEDLDIPYDVLSKELRDRTPRIVDGKNVYQYEGKIKNAPGINDTGLTSFTLTKRPDRLVSYETLENPPKVYLLASLYNSGTTFWEMWYLRLDAGAPAWTTMGTLRDLDESTRPHEILTAKGLAFIKSYPGAAGDKYGSVIFDGTTPFTTVWGYPGPTTPARVTASAGWGASSNPVTVLFGWKYAYSYVTRTGHISNRSALSYDPAYALSDTGAFTNKKPAITVEGLADTTNIPYIQIWRTMDGGGTFFALEKIANTGAGAITYTDNHRVPSTTNDPQKDAQLDTSNIAPSEVTNTVPPPVGIGGTIGTTQVAPSTNMAYYARRVWYGIGNRLYFSGQEEILNGVPEESFVAPNGFRGNYFIFKGQNRLVKEAKETLIIATSDEVLWIRGTNRTNLTPNILQANLAAQYGQPRAITTWGDFVIFLSDDLQLYAAIYGVKPVLLSKPLGTKLRDAITAVSTNQVALEVFSRDGQDYLICAVIDKVTPANNQSFVFDLNKEFWFPPWVKKISAMTFGKLKETDSKKHLIILTWDGTTSKLGVLDPAYETDAGTTFAVDFTLNLFSIPSGNQINSINQPLRTPEVAAIVMERTKFTSDTEPTAEYRLDEFSGALTTLTAQDPPYTPQHASYYQKWYPISIKGMRVQLKISRAALSQDFEIQNIGFAFRPEDV